VDEFIFSYFLTIIIETAVLFILLRQRHAPILIARNAIIASSLTLPFVWFAFPVLCSGFLGFGAGCWFLQTALAEIFAVVAETAVYQKLFSGMCWKSAFFLSLTCNAVSFGVGLALI